MKPSFEQASLEQEIKQLAVEIKERGLSEKGKEALKTVLKEQIGSAQPVTATPAQPPQDSAHLPAYLNKESAELKLKVEKLLDLALRHGIKRAADEAKGMNPLELDAFHDALTDKLYPELKSRGLLD